MAATLDATLDAVFDQVRRLFDPSGCAFLIIDRDAGRIEPAASWFQSPEVAAAMGPVLSREYTPESPGLTEAAVERGAPLVLRDIERWEGGPALRERLFERLDRGAAEVAWEWYRQSCLVACPVSTARGRVLGVLAVAAGPGRKIGEDDLRAVSALAALAALALERSELLEREAARASEEALLRDAVREMTASLDLERVHAAIVLHACRLAEASAAKLHQQGPGTLENVAGAAGRALQGERPERDGDRLYVPVALGHRVFGVLELASPASPEAERRVTALAPLAAAAIANAVDHARERRVAEALSRGFVPSWQPELPGVEVGLVYEPADVVGGGGDFFGLWQLAGGGLAVLVGDVSGKGLEVSATSAMVRFFVEARTWDCADPGTAFAQTNALLCARTPQIGFATAFLAILSDGRLRYANAGHVPPLVLRADGHVEELAPTGVPLGFEPAGRWEEREVAMASGELLFATTDGLIEARRGSELFGEARVRELLESSGRRLGPQELVHEAHAAAMRWAGTARDDIVALAVRRR